MRERRSGMQYVTTFFFFCTNWNVSHLKSQKNLKTQAESVRCYPWTCGLRIYFYLKWKKMDVLLVFWGTQEFNLSCHDGELQKYCPNVSQSACLTGSHWLLAGRGSEGPATPFVSCAYDGERSWRLAPIFSILIFHEWQTNIAAPSFSPISFPQPPHPQVRFHHHCTWANTSRWNRRWGDENKPKNDKKRKKKNTGTKGHWKGAHSYQQTHQKKEGKDKKINGIWEQCQVLWGKQNITKRQRVQSS